MIDGAAEEPLIFVSYASLDRERVKEIVNWLDDARFRSWVDYRQLLPGQKWDYEIKRALDRATIIVLIISNNSIDKRGYVQREIRLALEKNEERLIDDIFIIPILLDDDATVPSQLSDFQFLRYHAPDSERLLTTAIRQQLTKLGMEVKAVQEEAGISWARHSLREERDGIPGYEVDIQYPSFSSQKFSKIEEINARIRGEMVGYIMEQRQEAFEPFHEFYNFGQDKFRRTNTCDVSFSEPRIVGRVLSLVFLIHWYGAGAAHPNHGFATHNFVLDPLFEIPSFGWLFNHDGAALTKIQQIAREQLLSVKYGDDESPLLPEDMVTDGTKDWESFHAYAFQKDTLELLFGPYSVGPYAAGPQFIRIPYKVVAPLMKVPIRASLGLEHLS